jgi:hypothetical protein
LVTFLNLMVLIINSFITFVNNFVEICFLYFLHRKEWAETKKSSPQGGGFSQDQ